MKLMKMEKRIFSIPFDNINALTHCQTNVSLHDIFDVSSGNNQVIITLKYR